jgi:2-polyprenyl-3-methyl-5-hydroxy-6-metoxy-1,4-benzoquinol methylase
VRSDNKVNIEAAIEGLQQSFHALARSKVDLTAWESAPADIKLRTDKAVGELNQAVVAMGANKADRVALETALAESRISIEAVRSDNKVNIEAAIEGLQQSFHALARSKVDLTALESAHADIKLRTDKAVGELNQAVVAMGANEADRVALETALAESRISIEGVRSHSKASIEAAVESIRDTFRSKVDLTALESVHAAVGELNQAVAALGANKADRVAIETALEESRLSIEGVRSSNKANIDAGIEGLQQSFHAMARSKVDLTALESAHADIKARTEKTLEESRVSIETSRREIQEVLQKALGPVKSETRDVKRTLIDQERRLGLLLEEARKRFPKPISASQMKKMLAEEDHLLDAMYASFEDIFRGTREDIKQRQSIYLPYVKSIEAGVPSAPIVDIGCGRGEWLELLGDAGLKARGVDLNRIFLDRCRELNLDVVESDVIEFLREQKPNSLGAVTSFHLIEHLPHKSLIGFLDGTLRALRPGGLAIFETPNPRNLQVGSCNFYLDPTHRNPLPPDLMRYLFEARGFVQVEIIELHPFPDRITDGAPAVNEALNRVLFSAQDYAVIGKKPK